MKTIKTMMLVLRGRIVRRDKRHLNMALIQRVNAWMDGFGTDDDEVPTEEVSPKLMEEISEEIDEAQLQKVVNDMLRERCSSGEEHYYQRDPKAPPMTLLNQDLFYLKHGNSGKKYTLSLHKYPERVLEKLKKYNKDVKYGYVDPSPSDADDEYLRFYEEDIEDRFECMDRIDTLGKCTGE
ncbi:hypothetical protein Tco_1280161 [Tanacetum coccineum]